MCETEQVHILRCSLFFRVSLSLRRVLILTSSSSTHPPTPPRSLSLVFGLVGRRRAVITPSLSNANLTQAGPQIVLTYRTIHSTRTPARTMITLSHIHDAHTRSSLVGRSTCHHAKASQHWPSGVSVGPEYGAPSQSQVKLAGGVLKGSLSQQTRTWAASPPTSPGSSVGITSWPR